MKKSTIQGSTEFTEEFERILQIGLEQELKLEFQLVQRKNDRTKNAIANYYQI